MMSFSPLALSPSLPSFGRGLVNFLDPKRKEEAASRARLHLYPGPRVLPSNRQGDEVGVYGLIEARVPKPGSFPFQPRGLASLLETCVQCPLKCSA